MACAIMHACTHHARVHMLVVGLPVAADAGYVGLEIGLAEETDSPAKTIGPITGPLDRWQLASFVLSTFQIGIDEYVAITHKLLAADMLWKRLVPMMGLQEL